MPSGNRPMVSEDVLPLSAMSARTAVLIVPSISQPVEICCLAMRKPLPYGWSRYFSLPQMGKWRRRRFAFSERTSGADSGRCWRFFWRGRRPAAKRRSAEADVPGGRAWASVPRMTLTRRWRSVRATMAKTALTIPTPPLTNEDWRNDDAGAADGRSCGLRRRTMMPVLQSMHCCHRPLCRSVSADAPVQILGSFIVHPWKRKSSFELLVFISLKMKAGADLCLAAIRRKSTVSVRSISPIYPKREEELLSAIFCCDIKINAGYTVD